MTGPLVASLVACAAALTHAAEPPAPEPADDEPPSTAEVVITATRTPAPVRGGASAATVLPRALVVRSPSKTIDELLRTVPSFGLFRRSSSLVADPTSQGVNLRGIGPSGVSRSLVLVDAVPENDPFGGWVYWRAISLLDVDRIEVVPGGNSALYGSFALGGVTQVLSRELDGPSADLVAEYGAFETWRLGGRVANRFGRVGAAVDAEWLDSGGYPVVAPGARGAIDGDAPSAHVTVNARLEAAATDALSFRLRGGFFDEDQHGGTRFTTASVRRLGWSAGARWEPAAGTLDLAVFGHAPRFEQDRARVTSAPRATAERSASQRVPARDLGAGLLWTSAPLALGATHTVTLGTDVKRVTGTVKEDLFPATVGDETVVHREGRGEQRLVGVFVQDAVELTGAVAVTAAVRWDRWDNVDARRLERLGGGTSNPTAFPDRSDDRWSPKVGVRIDPSPWLTLRAAAYRAFRAPTLNELYRPFQVGVVLTEANANLGPETLRGAEAGLDLAPARGLTARLTGFWNELDDPIVNASCAPGTSSSAGCDAVGEDLQQRQNLGRARIRGVEAEAAWRLRGGLRAVAAWTFVDGRVVDARGGEQLGRELPQNPRHRASLTAIFDDPRLLSAFVQVRYVGRQFEDDLNTRPMPGAFLVDASASRRVAPGVELVLSVENLFDREVLVGRAGVDTVGQPRFVHGGLRVRYAE